MTQIQSRTGKAFVNMKADPNSYTKQEVDILIAKAVETAVEEARKIDEESMAKHNRDATVLSMILGFTTLALFVDGFCLLYTSPSPRDRG